jgi:hypothetical protein
VADHVAVLRPFAAEITLQCHNRSIPTDNRFVKTRLCIVSDPPMQRLRREASFLLILVRVLEGFWRSMYMMLKGRMEEL